MKKLLEFMERSATQTDLPGFAICLGISLLASAVVMMLYLSFYENRRIGAQAHRFFLIGGPSITAMLLAIQFSLPLSLGLLGALSFVRFRTAIKEPEEIAYLLLLIASSIGCATYNFALVGILILFALAALLVQRLLPSVLGLGRRRNAHLLLSFTDLTQPERRNSVGPAVLGAFAGCRLESLTEFEGTVSYHFVMELRSTQEMDRTVAGLRDQLKPDRIQIMLGE